MAVKKPAKKPVKKAAIKKETVAKKTKKDAKEPKFVRTKTRYDDSMGDKLISIMRNGDSRAHFCSALNISYETFDHWREKNPEFEEAYRIALCHSEKWWQNMGKDYITHAAQGTHLNSVAWSMNMRNRFRWTEHRTIHVPGLKDAPTLSDKFEVLVKEIGKNSLTGQELSALNDTLNIGLKIMEAMELQERVEKLETLLAEKENEN